MKNKLKFTLIALWVLYSSYSKSTPSDSIINRYYTLSYHYSFLCTDSLFHSQDFKNCDRNSKDAMYSNFYWCLAVSGKDTTQNMKLCEKYSDEIIGRLLLIEKSKLNEDELFYIISAIALKARIAIFQGNYFRAVGMMKKVFDYLSLSKFYYQKSDKLLLTTGLYFYYIEYAIETNKILYPYLIFYPRGNKANGIAMLRKCLASENVMVKSEACYFLMKIYLDSEKNLPLAAKHAEILVRMYPENLLYRYHLFKIYLDADLKEHALEQYKLIQKFAAKNNELSIDQKNHFIKIANRDLGRN